MAKSLAFTLGKKEYFVDLGRKVSKDDLYRKVRRVIEKDGQPLARGLLAPDGSLLARKSLSTVRLGTEGTPVEPEEVLHDGQPVESLPSSFDEAAALEKQRLMEKAKPPTQKKGGGKKPKIIERSVYRKADAVRKLVVTERVADDATIPFVVYITDYSAGRKDPLKVTTQYAQTKERKEVLVERLLAKNIKKGWDEVGVQAPTAKALEKNKQVKPAKAPAKKSAKPAPARKPTKKASTKK